MPNRPSRSEKSAGWMSAPCAPARLSRSVAGALTKRKPRSASSRGSTRRSVSRSSEKRNPRSASAARLSFSIGPMARTVLWANSSTSAGASARFACMKSESCGKNSGSTLNDPEFFPQLSDFMQANRALAPALVLEFAHSTLRAMGPIENESLAALADLGFRFSLDRLTDLRVEPRELADRGFRFVKAPATLLLNRAGAQGADIHPADFSDLLGRFGIDLIADRIESEGMVVDLLDYDVRFGQGFLFSPPRPVRTEALGIGERGEPARSGPAAVSRAAAAGTPPVQPAETLAPEQRGDRRAGMLAQLARGVVRRA